MNFVTLQSYRSRYKDKAVQRAGDYDDIMLEEKMIQKENAIRKLKGERGIEVNSPEQVLAVRNISLSEGFHNKFMGISTSDFFIKYIGDFN
jgi:hypothetical protein